MNIPMPPANYWTGISPIYVFGYLITALLIVFVLAPFVMARVRGKPSAALSREQSIAAREASLNERQNAEWERLEADRDRGWDLARGWNALAHRLWHDNNGAVMRANGLLLMLQRVLNGKIDRPAGLVQVQDFEPLPTPKPLPDIEEVAPKKPGETPYA